MNAIGVSVVVPTRNRPGSLRETLGGLARQDAPTASFEVVVVDDGSSPPVSLPPDGRTSVLRLEGVERSAARNAGASGARGHLLIFLDDDMSVREDFVRRHQAAQQEWPGALVVGGIVLPGEMVARPFGRFRQILERGDLPTVRGLAAGNFCAAGNMSMPTTTFRQLGGFDPTLRSSEDQDLALRHTAGGGRIAFLPEAEAIHRDSAADLRSYCRRTEWGSEHMVPFCLRYPDWPANEERARINGPLRWRTEHLARNIRRLAKAFVAAEPTVAVLFRTTEALERHWPRAALLDRFYRLLLGAHIFRGYRRGLASASPAATCSSTPGSDSPVGRE